MTDNTLPDGVGNPLQKVDLIVPGVAVRVFVPFHKERKQGTCIGVHPGQRKPYQVLLASGKTLFLRLAEIELDYERERAKLAPIAFYPCPRLDCQARQVQAKLLVDIETDTRPDLTDEGYRQYWCLQCRAHLKVNNQDGQLVSWE